MKHTIASVLTAEQMMSDSGKDYNESIWVEKVKNFLKHDDVTFYKVDRDDVYAYDRYFVSYKLFCGLRLFNVFSYSSSLSNGGFTPVSISGVIINEKGEVEFLEPNKVSIFTTDMYTRDGEKCRYNNSEAAKLVMIEKSEKFNTIWTKLSI